MAIYYNPDYCTSQSISQNLSKTSPYSSPNISKAIKGYDKTHTQTRKMQRSSLTPNYLGISST